MLRRLEMDVRDQQDADLVAQLDGLNILALLVEQEGGDIHRHLRVWTAPCCPSSLPLRGCGGCARPPIRRCGCGRCRNSAGRGCSWSRRGRAQALARQFHQAEAADLAGLHAGAVEAQPVAQAVLDLALVALVLHVDEVDDDQAAKSRRRNWRATSSAASRLVLNGFFDVGAARRAAGVDVDRNQRFRYGR